MRTRGGRGTMRVVSDRLTRVAAVMACLAWLHGCARPEDAPTPVASIAVTPSGAGAEAGAPLEFTFRFTRVAGAPALSDDLWVFVHLVDEAGMLLWTDDHRPPVPPSTWGAAPVTYRRTMFVPRLNYKGRVRVEAGLYAPDDGTRVRLTGEEASRSYTVASFEVLPAAKGVFVAFGDGWYGAERAPQEPLREWRWSSGAARLSFRHPGGDATLWIELDQPVAAVGTQRLELREGPALLATLAITPGTRYVREVPLRTRPGTGSMVELDVKVEPTFVPATVPSLGSQDARELGVRVFNVYVGAK